MGMEPIDGIIIFFSGQRQQSILEKVRNWAVRSASSEHPAEEDGKSVGALAWGPLEIGLSFPTVARTVDTVREYEPLLLIWERENRP